MPLLAQNRAERTPKRSIKRDGKKSSVSLEEPFWNALQEIAERNNKTVSEIVATIDHGDNRENLSSAIRVFVIEYYMAKCRSLDKGLPVSGKLPEFY